jgi:MazG family protein
MTKHTKEEKMQAFGRLLDIQDRLRVECPWDRKQTNESLRPNTIEEVYELCDALMKDDTRNICKELGDVMEHVIFYAMIGSETDDFDIADVCDAQSRKLMFRHPFIDWTGWRDNPYENNADVMYDDTPQNEVQVEATWEQIKQREKDGNKTVLSGVPDSLPSVIKAYRIQDKARNVGFDWKDKADVWNKVREELGELEVELRREDSEKSTDELGDFLFSVINAARLYHLNPDNALERTNQKFIRRFGYVEAKAKELHKSLKDMNLAEMDKYWDEAKRHEKNLETNNK